MDTTTTTTKGEKPFYITLLAALGSGLEYYDFVIYGMMAKYLGALFFPSHDGISSMVQYFTIFTVGYWVRPLGGIVFGMVADLYGRKKAFSIVMLSMALSTLGMGLLPTYQQIGMAAPILMFIFRLLQGISFGAELPNAITIVSELDAKQSLGKLCSCVLSSTAVGALFATSILAILTNLFDYEDILYHHIWRIPFLLGGILAVASYYIRREISETSEFLMDRQCRSDTMQKENTFAFLSALFKQNMTSLLVGFGLALFLATMLIINLYFPVYLSQYFDYALSDVYMAMTGGMIASFILTLMFGWLSDHISKFTILLFAIIGFVLSLLPSYWLITQHNFYAMQLFLIMHQIWIAAFFTSYLPVLSRLFPTNQRCTGFALVHNFALAIASTIPTLATYFFSTTSPLFILWFLVIPIIFALLSVTYLIVRYKPIYIY